MTAQGRKRALLVGIAAYRDTPPFHQLPFATADTAALRQVLGDPAVGQFDEVLILNDPGAAEMREQIARFLGDLDNDDLGLLYVSGHGYRDTRGTGEFFFVASDTTEATIQHSGVGASFVNEQLEESPATRKVAIFDCCFSGGFSLGMRTEDAKSAATRPGMPTPSGVYVMSSSGIGEASWADPRATGGRRLSLFTAELVEALRTGSSDADNDGAVTVEELFHHVNRRVRQIPVGEHGQQYQVPTSSSQNVNASIVLARSPASPPVSTPARKALPEQPPPPRERTSAAWADLLTYYRDCLETTNLQMPLLGIDEARRNYVCLPGRERLLSHDLDSSGTAPVPGEAGGLVARAGNGTAQLWCGYPAVVLLRDSRGRPYRNPRFAPLFIRRAEVVSDGRLRPYGEVTPHPELVRRLLPQDQANRLLETYRARWQAGMPHQMAAEIRHLAEILRLDLVQELRPDALEPTIDARTPSSGIRNAAILFLAKSDTPFNAGLLKDLAHLADPRTTVAGTALSALTGGPGAADPRSWHPVLPWQLNDCQQAVLRSAMTWPITVATGPPGTGKSQLVAGAVATAVANGQTVLVASTNNRAVDEVWERCDRLVPGLLIRTGSQHNGSGGTTYRAKERQAITALLGSPPPPPGTRTAQAVLWQALREQERAREVIAEKETLERELLRIARDRQAAADLLGFSPERLLEADLDSLAVRAKRVSRAKLFGDRRRRRLCRQLGLPGDDPAVTCRAVGAWARQESAWRRARARLDGLPDDASWERTWASADEKVRTAAHQLLKLEVATGVAAGRRSVETLLNAGQSDWAELRRALPALRGWAVTSQSVRRFPPAPGLFDLVIVDEASQCSIPQVLPLLYRSKRALIIGDRMQLAPVITLTPAQEAGIRRAYGLNAGVLEERRLNYRRHSAFDALSVVAGKPLLLDEHFRCHPDIAAIANEQFYHRTLTVLTDLRRRPVPATGPAVTWSQVSGSARRDADDSWYNTAEASRVTEEVTSLLARLPAAADIGIITPFKGQARLLGERWSGEPRVQVGTVHTFQGGERDIIVLSLVADPELPSKTREWLSAQRNLWNVAITRARSRLVLVGDREVWQTLDDIGPMLVAAASARPAAREAGPDDLPYRLYEWLSREPANQVTLSVPRNGYVADAVIRAGTRETAVLLDRGPSPGSPAGQHLRRQLTRTRLLDADGSLDSRRVPAWNLFEDPAR